MLRAADTSQVRPNPSATGLLVNARLAVLVCLAVASGCLKPHEEHLKPVDVSQTQGRAERPSIAVGPDGTAYLAWSEWNRWTDNQGRPVSAEDVRLATKPPGGTWSEPLKLTTGDPSARYPSIAVDRNGVVHVAWQQSGSQGGMGYWVIAYTRRAPGDTWTTPDTITMYRRSTVPSLAADQDAGRVHLYWEEHSTALTGYTCYACRPEGGVWQDFQSFPFDDSTVPGVLRRMQTNGLGSVHLVENLGGKIYHRERTAEGLWKERTRLSENATGMGAYWPSFAFRSDGGIRVVWADDDTCYRGFAFRERSCDGTWLPAQGPYRRVWRQSFWGYSHASNLGCVNDSQDRLHVVWQGVSMLGYATMADGVWSQPKVLAESVQNGGPSAIVAGPDGSILYAWASQGDGDIFCVEYDPR